MNKLFKKMLGLVAMAFGSVLLFGCGGGFGSKEVPVYLPPGTIITISIAARRPDNSLLVDTVSITVLSKDLCEVHSTTANAPYHKMFTYDFQRNQDATSWTFTFPSNYGVFRVEEAQFSPSGIGPATYRRAHYPDTPWNVVEECEVIRVK